MGSWFYLFLLTWLRQRDQELMAQIQFLKAENEILRSRLPTPSSTPSVNSTPTQFPNPDFDSSDFEGETLQGSGWAQLLGGFIDAAPGTVALGALGSMVPGSEDGRGLMITVQSGQVSFLYHLQPIQTQNRPVLIRALLRAYNPNATVTLVALKGSITSQNLDGSMAFHSAAGASTFEGQPRGLVLVYQPDNGGLINLAFQVAAHANAGPVNVYVDNIESQILNIGIPYDGRLFDNLPDTNGSNRGIRR